MKRFGTLSRGAAALAIVAAASTLVALGGCARAQEPSKAAAAPIIDEWTKLQERYAYDASKPLKAAVQSSQMGFGGTTETATIIGSKGNGVPLLLITPTSASETNKVPGVVLLHGLGGKIEDMQMVGQYLAMSGFAVVIPEIVGHGERADGGPLFDGDVTKLQNNFIESVGDVRRAIDYMGTNPVIDKNRTGLVGMSLGAILGSITQGLDSRIKTSVLLVGGGDWNAILKGSTLSNVVEMRQKLASNPNATKELDVIDPKTFAGHIAPRTVLMINGRKDTVIPEAAANALWSSLRGKNNKQMWLPGGHGLMDGGQGDFMTQVAQPAISWLQRELDAKTIAKRAAELVPADAATTDAAKTDAAKTDAAKPAAPKTTNAAPKPAAMSANGHFSIGPTF